MFVAKLFKMHIVPNLINSLYQLQFFFLGLKFPGESLKIHEADNLTWIHDSYSEILK